MKASQLLTKTKGLLLIVALAFVVITVMDTVVSDVLTKRVFESLLVLVSWIIGNLSRLLGRKPVTLSSDNSMKQLQNISQSTNQSIVRRALLSLFFLRNPYRPSSDFRRLRLPRPCFSCNTTNWGTDNILKTWKQWRWRKFRRVKYCLLERVCGYCGHIQQAYAYAPS